MVDIHCHILPGMDDGAKDPEEALLMARLARGGGTKTIIATPHYGQRQDKLTCADIRREAAAMQRRVQAAGLDLEILPGMELLCGSDFDGTLESGDYLTLAGSRYLLTEFYFDESPEFMDSVLMKAAQRKLVPIVAHPERYEAVQEDPMLVAHWIDMGCGIQVNAGSLLGRLGRGSRDAGAWLVRSGLVHIVASDGHDLDMRVPSLRSVREYLEERVSEDCAWEVLFENPKRVAQDLPLLSRY